MKAESLKLKKNFENGKQEGITKVFFESGKLESEIPYKNNKPDGLTRKYFENGKLMVEGTFKDGSLDGEENHYSQNGKHTVGLMYKNNTIVSGICYHEDDQKVPLTNAEITNLNNGYDIQCP